MTECVDDSLDIGTDPGDLTYRVVPGERSTPSLMFAEENPDGTTGDPLPWPEAPVMVFADFNDRAEFSVTADLSASEAPDPVVADAVATWELTPEQTALLVDYAPVRIRVDDETWWSGVVSCQS